MKAQHPRSGRFRQWAAVLAGPVLWAVHFMTVYLLSEAVCKTAFLDFELLNAAGPAVLMLGLTLLLSLITLLVGFSSYRERGNHNDFASRAAVLLNGLFTLVILAEGVPLFLLELC